MKSDFLRSCGLALSAAFCLVLVAAPALAQPSYAIRHETLHGRVTSFDGHYGLTVRDDRGYLDRITLRDGTVINPTGLRLAAGMQVTIIGETSGSSFVAFEIDTPYSVQSPEYAPAYPPPAYPPPAYGAPDYSYPPPGYTYPYPPPYYPPYPYPVYYPGPYFSIGLGLDILIGGHGHYGHRR